MKFEVKNRFSRRVQFTAEIACGASDFMATKLRHAVEWAVENNVNLEGASLRGANLEGANLEGVNLEEADLRGANLRGANLRGANLRWADLRWADLRWADLRGANLEGANLEGAYLERANLYGAYLRGADLERANLERAYLERANLERAYLYGADLRGADLREANLREAKLRKANLKRAKNIPAEVYAQTSITPEEGSFIAWKKAGDHIVKLEIPSGAKRSNATGRKCRASYVKTLAIYPNDTKEVVSAHGGVYRVGRITRCHEWDKDRWEECSGGIHFFMTRAEAEAW